MYIVGIDIAKRKHEAAVIDGDGAVIIKPFSFTNNCSGYNRLLAMLAKAKLPLDEVSFAMEATGHYWLALFTRLQKEGFRVQVINPVQTNSIRSFYIRQAKTDPRDALLIAEVIRFGHFSESTLHPENIYELRELCRGRHAIVSMQADVKRKVVALLDQVFPEYETAFTNLFGDTSMAILQTCPTPKVSYNTRLRSKNRTQRLTRRNRSLPSPGHSTVLCCQRNPFCSATLLYTYISRFTVNPHYISRGRKSGKVAVTVLSQTTSRRAFQLLPQTAHVCFHSRKRVHTRLSEKNRTQGHTRRNRGVSDGGGITTLGAFHTFRNPCVAGA